MIAWGDSLTFGSGTTGPARTFPFRLGGLSHRSVENRGVVGETSTQIKDRMLALPGMLTRPAIIWAGRNNLSSPSTVLSDVALAVAALGHSNYLVLGVLNASGENTGSANYINIATINAGFASAYGSRYVDVRSYLVSQYNPNDAQDVIDHGNDVTPTSLRSDTLHLNDAGYLVVANKVYESIALLGVS